MPNVKELATVTSKGQLGLARALRPVCELLRGHDLSAGRARPQPRRQARQLDANLSANAHHHRLRRGRRRH